MELPQRVTGAVLYADISGFSPLTRVLAEALGAQRGAEELTSYLNTIYGALIAEINRHNGSVVSFSGDALLCWFDGDNGLRATGCAFAMQAAMRTRADVVMTTGERIRFALKTSVAVGQANRIVLGDPNIQLFDVLAGDLLDLLAATDHVATGGDVVVDDATATQLATYAELGAIRMDVQQRRFYVVESLDATQTHTEHQTLNEIELAPEQARPWMPAPVFERLSRGQGEFLAELRPAVAFFARFDYAATANSDDAYGALAQFVRDGQRILARFEGTLLQVTLGEKGNFLYAAFGAPIAHENDAMRAVAVADALHALAKSHPAIHGIQIGISQGRMRVGAYGGPTRRTYGALGNEVNIAARLMEKAKPGHTLITARVAEALDDRGRVGAVGEMDLKGQSKPVTVFLLKPVDEKRTPQEDDDDGEKRDEPALVGREEEQATLQTAVQAISMEGAQCVGIVGEAGIGKSRLVMHAVAHATQLGIQVAIGQGEQVEQDTPYFVWRAILRKMLAIQPEDNADMIRARVLAQCVDDALVLDRLPLLNAVLPLNEVDNDLTRAMAGEVRADNTRDVVATLLGHIVRDERWVIVIEDAHWLDSASWQLLNGVRARVSSILMIVTARQAELDAGASSDVDLQRLRDDPRTQWISLQPLNTTDIHTLACNQLRVTTLPRALVEFIDARADGNPFFCEEIVHTLRETQLIRVVNGVCELQPGVHDLTELDFPDTIQGVVTSRLDRLPMDQQLTLKVASVFGRSFTVRALQDVYPVPIVPTDLQSHLDALCELDITPLETTEPEKRYIFKHNVTRDVVYGTMLFAQRRELHRAAGTWFEHVYADDPSPAYPLLAHHWRHAVGDTADDIGAAQKALRYLELGGDQAVHNSAYREAVSLYSQLLEVDGLNLRPGKSAPSADRARWYAKIGEAYRGWGRFSDGMTALSEAVALYGEPLPVAPAGLVGKLLREVVRQAYTRARPARRTGTAPVESVPRLKSEARANQFLAEMLFFDSKPLASLYASMRMLNVSERAGHSAELAEAYGAVSLLTGVIGLHSLADAYHARALDVARAVDQPAVLADVLRIDALYRIGMGQFAQSERDLTQALDIAELLRDKRHLGDCRTLLAHIAFLRGEFDASSSQSAEIVAQGQRDDNPTLLLWGLFLRASNELRLGNVDDALRLADEATQHADAGARIYTAGTLALARWHCGDHAGAVSLANEVSTLIKKSRRAPSAYNVHAGYVACAEIALADLSIQPSADRMRAAQQTCQHLKAYARLFPVGKPTASFYEGLLAFANGKTAQAQRLWRRSADEAKRLNMPYEQARALLELGRHAAVATQATTALSAAIQLFERLRTPQELQRARKAMEMAA
jgi:class 3 adenylate cyclase/tetratricopeptide (TPR) repeat protein